MREIKFKAWDKKEKKMLNRFEITQDGFVGYTDMFETYHPLPEVVLIQYTGLKDKNGKEIYEGDIVEHFEDEILLVKWIEEECRFYCLSNYGLKNNIMVGAELSKTSVKNMEVIGNIFENPELLEQESED